MTNETSSTSNFSTPESALSYVIAKLGENDINSAVEGFERKDEMKKYLSESGESDRRIKALIDSLSKAKEKERTDNRVVFSTPMKDEYGKLIDVKFYIETSIYHRGEWKLNGI